MDSSSVARIFMTTQTRRRNYQAPSRSTHDSTPAPYITPQVSSESRSTLAGPRTLPAEIIRMIFQFVFESCIGSEDRVDGDGPVLWLDEDPLSPSLFPYSLACVCLCRHFLSSSSPLWILSTLPAVCANFGFGASVVVMNAYLPPSRASPPKFVDVPAPSIDLNADHVFFTDLSSVSAPLLGGTPPDHQSHAQKAYTRLGYPRLRCLSRPLTPLRLVQPTRPRPPCLMHPMAVSEMFGLAVYFGISLVPRVHAPQADTSVDRVRIRGFSELREGILFCRASYALFPITDKSSPFISPLIVGLIADSTGNIRHAFFFSSWYGSW
ncbi:hypothetical protein HD554DRAFT_2312013 [Boletus coccyginus]|nr:hypothetical protein HD554DRAFT_2312013 [Boletus coccyginus]